jgi:hypothetical protein
MTDAATSMFSAAPDRPRAVGRAFDLGVGPTPHPRVETRSNGLSGALAHWRAS